MSPNANEVRRRWVARSSAYSPAYYAYYGPDDRSDRIRDVLDRRVGRDATVLELGCSSGRHLSHLLEGGYDDLAGIDLNDDAFEVMERTYPDLAETGTFYHDALEDVVPAFENDAFDVVYSVETLQHLHPDADWLFADLARVTDLLVTAEVEPDADHRCPSGDDYRETTVDGLTLYKRRWDRVLAERGFVERDATEFDRVTLRVFRVPDC